jgi:hypothetical protein
MAAGAAAGDTPDQQQDAEQQQQQQVPAAMPKQNAWATAQLQAGIGAEALANQLSLHSDQLQQQLREQLAFDERSPRRLSQNALASTDASTAVTAQPAAASSSSSSTKKPSSSSSSSSTKAAPAKPATPPAAAAAPRKPRVMCTSADLLENYIFTRSAYSNPLQAPLALHCPGSKAYHLIACMRMPSLCE